MADPITLTDASGRKLELRPLSLVEQYRLARAVGGDGATNQVTFGMAQTAAMVRAIDGTPLFYPTNDKQVEVNIEKIGEAGYAACIAYMNDETAKMMAATKAVGEDAGPLAPSDPSPDTPA